MYSFNDEKGRRWTACCECNRGGNGNDVDKCSSGWQCTTWNKLGCFIGTEIVGKIKKFKKKSRSKERYQRYLEYGDGFSSFINYCYWDADPERIWNNRTL